MNIFSTKLFPHIEGSMLQDKRVVLTVHSVNLLEVDGQKGKDIKTEIWFAERKKSALLNKTQTRKLALIYGPETDDWKGKPIALYGEFGKWFGKEQWALRVDEDVTQRSQHSHKVPKQKKSTRTAAQGNADFFPDAVKQPAKDDSKIPWDDGAMVTDHRATVEAMTELTVNELAKVLMDAGYRKNISHATASIIKHWPDLEGSGSKLDRAEALIIFDAYANGTLPTAAEKATS